MTVTIRRIRPDDGPVLRNVRLRALLDTPSAFARTHTEEHGYLPKRWTERAEWSAAGDHSVYFLGFAPDATDACGIVGAYLPESSDIPELVSMWVAPPQRGTPTASALVDNVIDWATVAGFRSIELWVTQGNDRAIAFYRRCGFVETDDVAPLPSDPCAEELRMIRLLVP